MAKEKITIGSRGSELALWQAKWVKSQLQSIYRRLEVELRIIRTTGDKILDTALSKIGDKGLFTREIEQQLLAGQIDLAVHSLKDLPTEQPKGLRIAAVTSREDPADVLVSKNNLTLEQFPKGAVVFTGSLRRKAQLLHIRGDLVIQDIRGNVSTRLDKFGRSGAQALIMAGAGLKRLGLNDIISQRLEPVEFLPACGQGALAIEIRSDDNDTAELVGPLNDADSFATTTAERRVLAELEGGCQVPVGAYGEFRDKDLFLRAIIADLDGTMLLSAQANGPADQPEELGRKVADELLDKGGRKILDNIRQENQNS